jgi:hypothetical protein
MPESNVGGWGEHIPDPPIKTAGTMLPFLTGKKWHHQKTLYMLKRNWMFEYRGSYIGISGSCLLPTNSFTLKSIVQGY